MYGILKKHHRQLIGWEEIYNDKLPADAIVHKWIPSDNSMIKSYGKASDIAMHNPVLISEGFYLDLFLPAYIHYNNAVAFADANTPNILGKKPHNGQSLLITIILMAGYGRVLGPLPSGYGRLHR